MGDVREEESSESRSGQVCYYDTSGRLVCTSSQMQMMMMQSPESDLDAAIDILRSFPRDSSRQRLAIRLIDLLQQAESEPSADVTDQVAGAVKALLTADTQVRALLFVSELQAGSTSGSQSTSAY